MSEINTAEERFSEILAEKISTKIIRWGGRTLIGLALFGVLCFWVGWSHWIFWSYLVVSLLSLSFLLLSYFQMIRKIEWAKKSEKSE